MMSKKRIGILMKGGPLWIGGAIYIQNLINSIKFLSDEERPELILFVWDDTSPEFYKNIDKDLFTLQIIPTGPAFKLKRFAHRISFSSYYHNHLMNIFKENKVEVIFPFYSSIESNMIKCVEWIPDFQYKYLPELFSKIEIKALDWHLKQSAKNADIVILSSMNAKKDFDLFYPDHKSKSRVMSFTSYIPDDVFDADLSMIKKKYALPDKFILVANQFWQHKDHMTLFYAINDLKNEGLNIQLVCTGGLMDHRNKGYYQQVKNFISNSNISSNIIILGFIPRYDQLQIMRLSAAIVQPSLFEGWSTVIEDGRTLGKTMFISDIPVHLEQNPDKAIYFKAKSKESLIQKLKENWEKLSSGPDFDYEKKALMRSIESMKKFANNFINIMNS